MDFTGRIDGLSAASLPKRQGIERIRIFTEIPPKLIPAQPEPMVLAVTGAPAKAGG